jgi:hypothetical protein
MVTYMAKAATSTDGAFPPSMAIDMETEGQPNGCPFLLLGFCPDLRMNQLDSRGSCLRVR